MRETTRKIFVWGYIFVFVLVTALGASLFVPYVDIGKMGVVAGFIPVFAGILSAMKVGARHVESKETIAGAGA